MFLQPPALIVITARKINARQSGTFLGVESPKLRETLTLLTGETVLKMKLFKYDHS